MRTSTTITFAIAVGSSSHPTLEEVAALVAHADSLPSFEY
jgi:hypothetical protein